GGPGSAAAGAIPDHPGALQPGFQLHPQALELEAVLATQQLQGTRVGEAHVAAGAEEHDAGTEGAGELLGGSPGERSLGGFKRHGAFLHRSDSSLRGALGPAGEARIYRWLAAATQASPRSPAEPAC